MTELRKPVDIATDHTVTFVRAHLRPEATLLEVGCGAGDVARALLSEGCDVLALDSDATAIAEARAHGVPARQADWPHFDGGPFDAIAFTRSLHHIHPLDAAVRRAHELLRPGGLVLVEDFAFADTDDATIDWFAASLRSQAAREHVRAVPGEFITRLRESGIDDMKLAWRADHAHELHPWAQMRSEVAKHFTVRDEGTAPYLYRYLIQVADETADAVRFVEARFRAERTAGEREEIMLIGRRLVGVR